MRNQKRLLGNQRGQSLAELVVTIFIISVGLLAILTFFMTSRQGVSTSWLYTQKNELANEVMERLKATPYSTLQSWELQYRVSGQAKNINPRSLVPPGHLLPLIRIMTSSSIYWPIRVIL